MDESKKEELEEILLNWKETTDAKFRPSVLGGATRTPTILKYMRAAILDLNYKGMQAALKKFYMYAGWHHSLDDREPTQEEIEEVETLYRILWLLNFRSYEVDCERDRRLKSKNLFARKIQNVDVDEKIDSLRNRSITGMNLDNAAALIRDDITTIETRHEGDTKNYRFKILNTLASQLTPNKSWVLVTTKNGFQVVKVTEVHKEPKIQPDGATLRWAFQIVDVDTLRTLEKEDSAVSEFLKQRKTENYRQQILGQFGLSSYDDVKKLVVTSGDDETKEEEKESK